MCYYIGILDGNEDVWGVRIPDVPGVYGGGATSRAAIQDAISALGEVAQMLAGEGKTLPEPRPIEQVRADPSVMEDLRPNDIFVLLPLVYEGGRPARANISMDAAILASIDEAAKARGLTRSAFLASAARAKILAEA